MTNFQPLFSWMKERDSNLTALHDAIKYLDEHGMYSESHPDYPGFEELWNEACAVLNRPIPMPLIQLIVRYEATLATIAATPLQHRRVALRPRIMPLLLAGDKMDAPTLEQDVLVCPVCEELTPLPILNGGGAGHKPACPVVMATMALNIPPDKIELMD